MNKTTLKALWASIHKYEELSTADDTELINHEFTGQDCALCRDFFIERGTCDGCPVHQAGHNECGGTPWHKRGRSIMGMTTLKMLAARARLCHEYDLSQVSAIVKHMRSRCVYEAKFLKSLLPPPK